MISEVKVSQNQDSRTQNKIRSQYTELQLTLWDVDSERASGNLLPSKGHIDGVRSLQDRNICAPENTVTFVLQDDLHRIPATVWINNDHADISRTSSWNADRGTSTHHMFKRTRIFVQPWVYSVLLAPSSGCSVDHTNKPTILNISKAFEFVKFVQKVKLHIIHSAVKGLSSEDQDKRQEDWNIMKMWL